MYSSDPHHHQHHHQRDGLPQPAAATTAALVGLEATKECSMCRRSLRVEWFARLAHGQVRLGPALDAVPRKDQCSKCLTQAHRRRWAERPLIEKIIQCEQSMWRGLHTTGLRTIQCPPSALATQYLLQEARCACCGSELEWTARGDGLDLRLEDREALGLWAVDDTQLPVLVSKQQETALADQAHPEAGEDVIPTPNLRAGSAAPRTGFGAASARVLKACSRQTRSPTSHKPTLNWRRGCAHSSVMPPCGGRGPPRAGTPATVQYALPCARTLCACGHVWPRCASLPKATTR